MEKENDKSKRIKYGNMIILIVVGISIAVIIFSVALWFLKKERTREDTNNPKNAPGAVRNFMNEISMGEDGKFISSKSINQLWEEMKNNGNDILKYLDSAEELAKLIQAAQALDFPDNRENPDEPINWKDIDLDSTEIQGIVKFKRALENGDNITMTYVTPSELQELMNKYMETGDEKDREEALKHFTIEKSYGSSSSYSSTGAKVQSLNGMICMGDSICNALSSALKKEGCITMHKSGCTAKYFLGTETVSHKGNCKENNGHFDWDANFKNITNPTGFYLFLGQNFRGNKNTRITQMDELIKKIRSSYPQAPIYINSVYRDMRGDNERKKKDASEMNEELKTYCSQNISNNVFYSDTLREYDDDDVSLHNHTYDDDHPNAEGARIIIKNMKENIVGDASTVNNSSSSYSNSDTSSTAGTTGAIANTSRIYNNDTFEKDTSISTQKKMSNPFKYNREYRSSQSGCYDGQYIIHFQNKNYRNSSGTYTVDASSKGGRIAWSNLETGEIDFTVEVGAEGGHGDGMAFDSDRNMVLKYSSSKEGNLLQIDNSTKTIVGHTKMDVSCEKITYLNTTKQLVALSGGKFIFMKYDQAQNKYVKQNVVPLKNYKINVGLQGIGTDGQVIYVADSGPGSSSSNYRVWTYTLEGERVEEHRVSFGGEEPEAVLSDNQGSLWAICNQHLFKIKNYRANPANAASTGNAIFSNTTYQVKVATWNEHQDKVVSDDPEVQSYDTGLIHEMTTTLIPYQPIVSKFKMPFNYLYTMLVYGQDKNFAFDLAQLVKNSRIEITIHDNVSITKNVSTDTYTNLTTINASANNAVVSFIDSSTNIDGVTQVSDLSANGTTQKNHKVVHTTIYNTDYLDIALTLADAWYTTYEKSYTYNEPTENTSNTSTKLDDKVLDQHGENTLGGLDGKFNNIAIDKAIAKISTITNPKVERITGKYAHFKTTRTNGVNKLYCYTKSSSYVPIPANDYSTASSVVTPKTGSLNKNNWVEFKPRYKSNGVFNSQQGFCFVGDDLIACVLHNWGEENNNKLNLIDANTFEVYDTAIGFKGHGNTIAFDSKTEDLIIPGCDGKMNLIHVNRSTRKLENIRKVQLPRYTNDYSTIAYNAKHDLFISDANIFTREAFYSRGERLRNVPRNAPKGRNYNGGCASYGDQIYHFFARPNEGFKQNYIVVVNILTGAHEETMCDKMSKEAQGIAFLSDGTLYTCYGGSPTSIWRTDYNYFYDNNINKSNVTPGASGNSIARYNTGGTYVDKLSYSNGTITKENVTRVFSNVDYSKGKAGQGFCLIDDQFLVHANANEGSNCDVYLYDIQTQQNCDSIKNLNGHGNSVAYDPIEKNIIVVSADVGKMHILKIINRKLQLIRTINTPRGRRHSLAYNKANDLFIRGTAVATREQFYSNSGKVEYYTSEKQPSNTFEQGEGSIGNHEFLVYNDNSRNGKCYISIINLKTRKAEKEIYVNLMSLGKYKNELEEVDFDSNGDMYLAFADHSFYKTGYNYYADASLSDKTSSDSNSMSDISRYNTGGEYIDKSSFEAIFNSNYNARTNILSVKEWFFSALEQNSDTKRMVDLTKYLMYKATGTDFGVTEFDFEAYQLDDFNEIGGQGLEGNTTEERVWLALINAGFNDVAAAAAMGNLSYESGGSGTKTIKTDSVEGGYTEDTGGIGMCQWTNNNRGTEGRNAQLKKYAQSKGTTWKDERTQIEFLITEITGEGNAKGYANLQFMTKTYDGVTYPKDALKTVSNTQDQIEYATKAFAASFERPAASAFTASMSKRVELAKYFYSMYNGKRGSSIGNGDILKACEEVMQNYLSKNVHYSTEGSKLISGNIKRCYNESNYICCATYTSSVLYKSGLLTEKQINEYNYHWTGDGGVPDMLKAAGWRQVPMSQIQPGDVVNDFTVHVLIYAGGDLYYDQGTCTVSSSGKQPTRKVKSGFSYYRNKNVQVWRAPGR